ncbi:hypothetical protein [Kamptonema formosum]|uniref:hypothetical protein n=1 Tax=Kamptonema formosum TaxID=331992 RepID=UPI00034767CE|nr:hypothetical protein [Oscillatoria sp. PCC 10802]
MAAGAKKAPARLPVRGSVPGEVCRLCRLQTGQSPVRAPKRKWLRRQILSHRLLKWFSGDAFS